MSGVQFTAGAARHGPAARLGFPPVATVLPVITGELRSKIDRVWDAFWSGGKWIRSR